MDLWIGKGNWNDGFAKMFIDLRDLMGKYELRLVGQSVRHTPLHMNPAPARTLASSLHVCITEPRRANLAIPSILRPLNRRLEESEEYETIDANDFMTDMTNNQRRRYLLNMHGGMSCPIFCFTWARGGGRAGVNRQVIWRVPPTTNKTGCETGMINSQINIDLLNKNTALYRSRAERSAYLATVVSKSFISSTLVALALYELFTGDVMSSPSMLSQDALAAAKFALNCQDPDIILDLRKLNGRPKNNLFDPFLAKIAEVVEGRIDDCQHGKLPLLCNAFLCIKWP
jgi:hypothetical protein